MPKFSKSQIRYAASKPRKKSVPEVQSTPQQIEKERAATRDKFQSLLSDYQKSKGLPMEETSTSKKSSTDESSKECIVDSSDQPHHTPSYRLAEEIENQLFEKHGNTKTQYREDFRKLFFALKNFDNSIQSSLLNGTISAFELVNMTAEQLSSERQKKENEKLQQENMRLATRNAADQPENIRALDDGRVGEKWWGGSSHAAIDD